MLVPAFILLLAPGSCKIRVEESADITTGGDTTAVVREPQRTVFGLIPDTFVAEAGRIGRNQLISGLLLSKGFTYPEIEAMLTNNQGSFDPKKVRSGNNYTFFWSSDTTARPSYLVYEHDNTLSHVISLTANPGITDYTHETTHEIKFVRGEIVSSLWEAAVTAGANPMLAVELSEIFAWSVDFFGLQKGDSFRVIYEEAFTADKSVGITSVNAAIFNHGGKDILAIPFMQDSSVSYYDEQGNSLRKAFLKAPLRYSRISSGYSSGRMHPILKIVRPHLGVDYAAPVGTPVLAIGDGRVISAVYQSAEGRIVRIRHNSVYSTAYLHLSGFAKGISSGVWVKQGDVIGYVGSTGLSTGPHLDFRFYKNGSPINPLKVESPSVEPVAPDNMERYLKVMETMRELLLSI
ncbi:MAG: peptidoglycan DD-metalloendopeptidase family protein [Bacteroidales bacterium]|nr:peptidoglycan DD-metalloendopeptidase family protein [Bacteroidales bacterium]